MTRGVCAIVPVKRLASAKSRLSGVMTPQGRSGLVLAMLRDVLDALTTSRLISGIAVVSSDPEIAAVGRACGARWLEPDADTSYTYAARWAAQLLEADGWEGLLAVPADVPLVTPEEIDHLVRNHQPSPSFTIVPARDRGGSNAIVCSPPAAVPASFGGNSFMAHLAAAYAAGIRPRVVAIQGLELDIDIPADLPHLLAAPIGSCTRTLLMSGALDYKLQTRRPEGAGQ